MNAGKQHSVRWGSADHARPTAGKAKPGITFFGGELREVLRYHKPYHQTTGECVGSIVMRGDFRVSALLLLRSGFHCCVH